MSCAVRGNLELVDDCVDGCTDWTDAPLIDIDRSVGGKEQSSRFG